MSRLKVPNLLTPELTIERWGAELRDIDFITNRDAKPIKYEPELSANGAMTLTAIQNNQGLYTTINNLVFFWVFAQYTIGGVANSIIFFTLPLSPDISLQNGQPFNAHAVVGDGATGGMAGTALLSSTDNTVGVRKYDASNYALSGLTGGFHCSGVYFKAP